MNAAPTPRQMHHFVCDMFELAGNLQCVRKLPDTFGAGKYAWFMIFPSIILDISGQQDNLVETYEQSCLRICRRGYTDWSLTMTNTFSVIQPSIDGGGRTYSGTRKVALIRPRL